MNKLNKHQVFAAKDLPTVQVDLGEWWNGFVLVTTLSIKDRLELRDLIKDKEPIEQMFEWIVKLCVNEDGTRMFTREDIPMLQDKHPKALDKIFSAGLLLNKVDEEEIEKKPGG